ncbi:hypothetical protein BJP36_43205 [Moorena producens JHB]|uniref:Uncharacterized protein n=1 Tax=Moorena producens (strain JHB) TaxID=1454205 RepID=A0A9Q9UVT4_MOOP1|nr:hypothetical protein [Moorena producens]WAN69170.1 hypothetical protein BJP36_43205 [Moorena producens JHB]
MGETPKTPLPSQDRNGALSVMARDCSPSRVAPLHRLLRFETNVDVLTALATAI